MTTDNNAHHPNDALVRVAKKYLISRISLLVLVFMMYCAPFALLVYMLPEEERTFSNLFLRPTDMLILGLLVLWLNRIVMAGDYLFPQEEHHYKASVAASTVIVIILFALSIVIAVVNLILYTREDVDGSELSTIFSYAMIALSAVPIIFGVVSLNYLIKKPYVFGAEITNDAILIGVGSKQQVFRWDELEEIRVRRYENPVKTPTKIQLRGGGTSFTFKRWPGPKRSRYFLYTLFDQATQRGVDIHYE